MKSKLLGNIILVLGGALLVFFIFNRLFELDFRTKQLIYRFSKIKPLDHVVVTYDRVFYSDLLIYGLPGDTVFIYKGLPYRNGHAYPYLFTRQFLIDLSSVNFSYKPDDFPVNFEYFTYAQYFKLRRKVLITPVILPYYFSDTTIYPYDKNLGWNKDNIGKIVVPFRGMVLRLTKYTYQLYKPLLEKYEKAQIRYKNGHFYRKNKLLDYYKFKHDYYYVLNTNLAANFDSRYWGPIPRKQIIGKRIYTFGKRKGIATVLIDKYFASK